MGAYIYTLRTNPIKDVFVCGEPIRVGCYKFAYKPFWLANMYNNVLLETRHVRPTRDAWEIKQLKEDVMLPEYAVLDKFEEGAEVYKTSGRIRVVDSAFGSAKHAKVGTLIKHGRKWILEKHLTEDLTWL
jgi:hypothetical protein